MLKLWPDIVLDNLLQLTLLEQRVLDQMSSGCCHQTKGVWFCSYVTLTPPPNFCCTRLQQVFNCLYCEMNSQPNLKIGKRCSLRTFSPVNQVIAGCCPCLSCFQSTVFVWNATWAELFFLLRLCNNVYKSFTSAFPALGYVKVYFILQAFSVLL